MTFEELTRGPNRGDGPDLSKPLLVTSAKSAGRSLGFTAKDARGDSYFVKLDPAGCPQLTTSTGVIGARFFHAFGYHVPEEYLLVVRPQDLRTDPESEEPEKLGMMIEKMFQLAAGTPDGSYQIIASRELPGKPLGPFRFLGTRPDDPNDIIPHENRRELRGLRVFCAWLNHTDSKSLNTLDTFISEGKQENRGYVRHYLIDFGSILAAGAKRPKKERTGHELLVDWSAILKSVTSLGCWQPSWTEIQFRNHPVSGHLEAEIFDLARWKPNYWNQAFERMTPRDAFWAVSIVARFTEEMIRSIVKTGRISSRADEDHLVEVLVRRQRKILDYYLPQLNPLADFQLNQRELRFRNLGAEAEVGTVSGYRFQWFDLDNDRAEMKPRGPELETEKAAIPLPESGGHGYLMCRIRTESRDQPGWSSPVDVYVRSGSQIVGLERHILD